MNMKLCVDSMDPKERFGFGKNWSQFLNVLDDSRIQEAEVSLQEKLGLQSLKGKIFLDAGSGSGLFSLAAYRLGAKVHSFDYDEDSVRCTQLLKEKYGTQTGGEWTVEQGSVLDADFLKKFGQVDIVYSWGVLHHTGHMHQAFENVSALVKKDGLLFISIYNDQGGASRRWKWIKEKYNRGSRITRFLLTVYTLFRQWTITFVEDFLKYGNPFKTWNSYGDINRGMSAYYDLVDWVGGYPFEVAKPEDVFRFYKQRGFVLVDLKTCAGGIGCNEFVFVKR